MRPASHRGLLRSCILVGAWVTIPLAGLRGAEGLAARYPGDRGLARDTAVLFAENFESGDLQAWDERRGNVSVVDDVPHAGHHSVRMTMNRGKDHGGDTIKWFMPGADTIFARFYVRFSPDYQYAHHFVWLSANQARNRW
jgi:hypothetical protein